MRNIVLVIEYDGTDYCGWQIQTRQFKTVQETIRKVLKKVLQENILLIGASRTDSGVHAKAQIANFKTKSKISLQKMKEALNGLLPEDIIIKGIKQAPLNFHSQFNAKEKTYRYSILNRKFSSVFLNRYVNLVRCPLGIKLMRQEAKILEGKHDFSSFQGSNRISKSPIRAIKKIKIKKRGSLVTIDVAADGFLYNMVRNIVGTLIEIGRGRFPKGSMRKILNSRDRKKAGPTAQALGLCLLNVRY